jgi:hypothetical protein
VDPDIDDLLGPSKTKRSLKDTLLSALPPANRSIPELARQLEITHQAIYKWLREEKLTPAMVKRIVELSDGRVNLHDFDPWVYR